MEMALSKKSLWFLWMSTRRENKERSFVTKSYWQVCHPTERHASKHVRHGISWNIMEYHECFKWNIPMIFPFKPSFLHLPIGDFPRMTPGFARGETKPPKSPGRGPLDASVDLVVKLLQQEYIYIYNDYINRDDYDYNSVIIIINYRD